MQSFEIDKSDVLKVKNAILAGDETLKVVLELSLIHI